jgi:dipeptidyl aminopeptidase/acylaminoacyl peptidase
MSSPTRAPYGSWKSPITSDIIAYGTDLLVELALDGEDVFWIESRAREKGRRVLMRRRNDGEVSEVLPSNCNVRTTVHEYGGSCFAVDGDTVYFSNFQDQRIYRFEGGKDPSPITSPGGLRFADLRIDAKRNRIICVREDHSISGGEPVNTLIAVSPENNVNTVLASGSDFYSSPRVSPDGSRLAWLTWNHPNMPWDGTELFVGEFDSQGSVESPIKVAGGPRESIFQPEWSPGGWLYFVSDRTGWWNLYRWANTTEPVYPMQAEFGLPQWVFGMSTYAIDSEDKIICYYSADQVNHLAIINPSTRTLENISSPYVEYGAVKTNRGHAYLIASSSTSKAALLHLDLAAMTYEVLYTPKSPHFDSSYLSTAELIQFPTSGGFKAFGLYYSPKNRDFEGLEGEHPPLLVMSHGGPTSAAETGLTFGVQFWTSRGIAVLDVNYRGSTGFGRVYREQLNRQWGIVDVDDCVNGACYLSKNGKVDGKRLMITGGSAGGYTTLCALTFHKVFSAGASHYGISDLDVLEQGSHKFESKYDQGLIGPYPERRDLFSERSPINHVESLSCPVIFFQGLDDKVVPPNQAELMVNALRAKKLPVAYLTFEGEQHGFRKAENIKRCLDAELYFYSKVLGFPLADKIEPVLIENLPDK